MPRSLTDCIKSAKFTASEEKYLTDKFTALKESGLDDISAGQRAIREFQDENLSTLNNLYAEVGVEDFTPMEVVRPRTEAAPISTVVGEKKVDVQGEVNKKVKEYLTPQRNAVLLKDEIIGLQNRAKELENEISQYDNAASAEDERRDLGFVQRDLNDKLKQLKQIEPNVNIEEGRDYRSEANSIRSEITRLSDEVREKLKSPAATQQQTSTPIPRNEVTLFKEGSPKLNTLEHDLKIGDKVTATISGQKETGTVTGVGEHKGQIVIDFLDSKGQDRFVYAHQVENLESGKQQIDNLTSEQKGRQKELLAKDELTEQDLNELKELSDIKSGKSTKQLPSTEKSTSTPIGGEQKEKSTPIQQEAAEVTPSIEEQGKELAAKIRQLKSKRDTLQANIFGIPIAIYDGLIETIATAVEKGTELAQAIQDAIASVKTRGFDKAAFTNHVEGFISGKKPRVKTTGEVFKKKKVRVRVPASQQRQQTGDPIDDFTLQFKDNIIIQDVLKTHENRDENYVANPNNYERNQIAMKAMRIEMDRIVTDVISANGLAQSGRYFISKVSDPNIPLWVKNTLMQSIQQNYRGRPDILNNLRVNFDTTMATESYVAFASRKDWLAEPGLTGEQEEDILDSFEEGKDIKKNKQNAQAAHDSNQVPPQVEQDIADRTQEDVAEEKAEVKKQSQKKTAPKKKKPAFDTEIYQSKRKAAENTLLGRNPNMSKQNIIDRIKEIIEKC